ncbi:MAG: hypothetical protein Q8R08_02480 [bacterium]|nr:hypothetical protein [bacterium]
MVKSNLEIEWENQYRVWSLEKAQINFSVTSKYGSIFFSCPECRGLGFYGAYSNEDRDRKYFACKFCGTWQEVSGNVCEGRLANKQYKCIHVFCSNSNCGWDSFDLWRLPSFCNEELICKNCKKTSLKKIKTAFDDSEHPFRGYQDKVDHDIVMLKRFGIYQKFKQEHIVMN